MNTPNNIQAMIGPVIGVLATLITIIGLAVGLGTGEGSSEGNAPAPRTTTSQAAPMTPTTTSEVAPPAPVDPVEPVDPTTSAPQPPAPTTTRPTTPSRDFGGGGGGGAIYFEQDLFWHNVMCANSGAVTGRLTNSSNSDIAVQAAEVKFTAYTPVTRMRSYEGSWDSGRAVDTPDGFVIPARGALDLKLDGNHILIQNITHALDDAISIWGNANLTLELSNGATLSFPLKPSNGPTAVPNNWYPGYAPAMYNCGTKQ